MSDQRKTPNFLLLYGGDANTLLPDGAALTGGDRRMVGEGRWEVVGLYHDEDEAFEALEQFEPGPERGAGQLVISQISDCAYGCYDDAGRLIMEADRA